ncbi:hypothetical protein C0J52_20887 [Blattella germanica]|nr:hypothetical protein C0J52_20887 [Blattella germanica]
MGCSPHIGLAVVLLLQLPLASYSKERYEENGRLPRTVDLVHPPSPCPSVFSYEGKQSEKDMWFGNWAGEVTSTDNIRFTILNLDKKVKPGPPHSVRIFVKFPRNEEIPRLKSISLNGREICPDHVTQPITIKPVVSPVTLRQTPPTVTKPTRPTPVTTEKQPEVSSQTAAHCVTKATVNHPLNPDLFLVYLGKYHLKQWSEGGVQDKQVVEIYVHPQYNTTNYQNDLAILILSSPVEYTTYVRPVCLWDKGKVDLSNVIGKQGIVAGWGFDENGQITEDLKMANMPIVSQTDCLWSNLNFFPHFTTNMTFCAGFQNGEFFS